ncbi:MAG: hypothetical protein ACRDRP_23395 [Pseudonocardiaceae bacterium]
MRKRNFLVAAGACLAALTLATPMALADPVPAGRPRQLAGMGSGVTEDVMNALSQIPASPIIGSYNAYGPLLPGPVGTKQAGCSLDRVIPRAGGFDLIDSNLSRDGVQALVDQRTAAENDNPDRRPCLDFARSTVNLSQDPQFQNMGLTFVPFASDQVSVVTRRDGLLAPNFTPAQLSAIFRCTAAGTNANPPTIVPLLSARLPPHPQNNFGTREFFLAAIDITEAQVGTCVGRTDLTVNSPTPLLENQGNRMTDPRNIMPHSVASLFMQSYGVILNVKDRAEIKRINNMVPRTLTFPLEFQREVYNVIPTSEIGNPTVSATFVGPGSTLCSGPLEIGTIVRFGLVPLPDVRCGATIPAAELQTPGPPGTNLPGPEI